MVKKFFSQTEQSDVIFINFMYSRCVKRVFYSAAPFPPPRIINSGFMPLFLLERKLQAIIVYIS
jgi:hypothetical protein